MTAAYSEIAYIDFGIATSEDHERDGCVEITNPDLFGGASGEQKPVVGGVYDARMGTTDHHYNCTTCSMQKKQCPGHPGTLSLRIGVQNPTVISETRRWLRITCLACGEPMVDASKYYRYSKDKRLAEASTSQTDGKNCPKCRAVHPKIVREAEDHFTFYAEYQTSTGIPRSQKLYPHVIKTIFERIKISTVESFGRSIDVHPSKFILTTIRIPPITIRPGVKIGVGTGPQSYHDVNNMIQYVVKRNKIIPDHFTDPISKDAERLIQNLQQLYYDMILGSAATNSAQGTSGKRGIVSGSRPTPAILRRLPRKEGRLRKNLLGKRVWSISRSTISGNSDLKIDEVGYPIAFARTLQIAEVVQEYNRDKLLKYFLNGRRQYPGSTRIFKRSTGSLHDVNGLRRDFRLEAGDILYRDVITGDFGFFNRQPSLERSAIGVHRIVILEDESISTFQMNVSACAWYNADFDGDQMNLWIPHGIMSRIEAEFISSVQNWFISTKNSGPVNGQVQDSTVGSYLLTRSEVLIDKYHAMGLFQTTKINPPSFSHMKINGAISGRDIISMLLERTPINYSRTPTWFSEVYVPYLGYNNSEIFTVIRNGKLERGVLDKKSVGAGSIGGLFHIISRSYGPKTALDIIFAIQQIAITYIGNAGFTVSINDMLVSKSALEDVHKIIGKLLRDSEVITDRLIRREIIPPIGLNTHQFYEHLQMNALKLPDNILQPILKSIDPGSNGLFQMVATGSKGSNPNMIHITAAVGQIQINTQRIQNIFSFGRTLPYFPRFALEPEAYGFIANGYATGFSCPQFIIGSMNGRFDLINKALSTAVTGYNNRKCVFTLQSDITDNYRRTILGSHVVQPLYGDDGLDARQVERVKFRTVQISDAELKKNFYFDVNLNDMDMTGTGTDKKSLIKFFDKEFDQIVEDRNKYRNIFLNFENMNFNYSFSDDKQMPVNIAGLVQSYKEIKKSTMKELIEMKKAVDTFCDELPYTLINEIQRVRLSPIPPHLEYATGLMKILIRIELCSRIICNLTPTSLTFILTSIQQQYSRSLIDYGVAVGILAAQSVSEPLTQYMLDSHHRSVSGGTNKSGIVRPQEIFSAKGVELEQSSEMLLRMKNKSKEKDRSYVQEIANTIELMTLETFIREWDLLYESYEKLRYPPYLTDEKWMKEFHTNHPHIPIPDDLTKWTTRYELDKTAMILKGMTLERIIDKLRLKYPYAYVIHTSENAPQIIIRIYFRAGQFRRSVSSKAINDKKIITSIIDKIPETILRGISGIMSALAVKIIRHEQNKEGEIVRSKDVYAIKTVGTNIAGVLMVDEIEEKTVVSSSIGDTQKVFGIEAAREKIISEIRTVMSDRSPNHRHLSLYAATMTSTGKVTSLEKGGINAREHENVLLRMSMSSPIQVLTDSALENIRSPITGIAGPLVLGSIPKLGTLFNTVIMDNDFISKNTTSIDSILDMI